MTTPGEPREAVEVLGAGLPQRAGKFEYRVADDRWWWSDAFYAILGFRPGEVLPSTSVLASHLRFEGLTDGKQFEAVRSAFSGGEPFWTYTHMVDARGSERTVLLTGHGEGRADGTVEVVTGYLVDLTEARRIASRTDVRLALEGALEHRAAIEQAKGVLMLAHGVDADEAFELLRTYSQDSNIKVRDLADRLVELVSKDDKPDQDFLRRVLKIFEIVD